MTPAPRAPVALFIFNRPETTARVARAVLEAQPPRLFVVADGPRAGRPGEEERCREARAAVESLPWRCEVRTLYAPANLGCKRRVASGIDWVFGQSDRAILLEDDCLPAPGFFDFCDELLERYRDDARVHMLRGTNFHGGRRYGADSYYFSRFYNIWGWATWARAWQGYDVELTQWPALRDSGWLERTAGDAGLAHLVRYFLDETHAGRLQAWDYQWLLLGWQRGAHAVVPQANLVTNIGYGPDATHTRGGDASAGLPLGTLDFPLRHPATVAVNRAADDAEWNAVYPSASRRRWFWQRLRARMRTLVARQ